MMKVSILYAIICLCLVSTSAYSQIEGPKTADVNLISTDIDNFWNMFDALTYADSKEDSLKLIKELYLDNASIVLRDYFDDERRKNNRVIEVEYLKIIRRYPKYLKSIRKATETIRERKNNFIQCFDQAKKIYPEFQVQDTYFCLGFFNAGGRVLPGGGLYVGVEFFSLSQETVLEEFHGGIMLDFLSPIDQIQNIVLHEQVHLQQLPPIDNRYNLLYSAINEGAAVFFVDLVTNGEGVTKGGGISERAMIFGDENEYEVWVRFKADMHGNNVSDWLSNAPKPEWPKDMGYYVGYKICQSYYTKISDKRKAIRNILLMNDQFKFLADSGYEATFEKKN